MESTSKTPGPTNEISKKPARRERNRRRAKDLNARQLLEVKSDFDIRRNTLEVAQEHLLPRAEAIDGVLIKHSEILSSLKTELLDIRRHMGLADRADNRPFLVPMRRTA